MAREVDIEAVVASLATGERSIADVLRDLPEDFPRAAEFGFALDPRDASVARVVPAAPGAATGALAFDAAKGLEIARSGRSVLLAVAETFPEDIDAMRASRGILAVGGGLTGHAAIVARGLGRPCVCGGSGARFSARDGKPCLVIEPSGATARELFEGDTLWFDGRLGLVAVTSPELVVSDALSRLYKATLDHLGESASLAEAFAREAPSSCFARARKSSA